VPLSQLNPKKKIFETIQPGAYRYWSVLNQNLHGIIGFTTLDTKEAAWVNPVTKKVHKIRTASGACVAPTLIGASLS
jgi:aminoacyl tRNA synthase complex-interacting multifunctional protein 1